MRNKIIEFVVILAFVSYIYGDIAELNDDERKSDEVQEMGPVPENTIGEDYLFSEDVIGVKRYLERRDGNLESNSDVLFAKIPSSDRIDIDNGWVLANLSDYLAHTRDVELILNRWDIVMLKDGWISGRGYGYKYGKDIRRGLGEKLIIKYKAAVLFRVITTSTQIPFSWRLASSKDLKNSMGEVKFVLNHVSGWVIAKLVDGQIGGRSYHFQIRTDIKGGSYGHQLIVNNEHAIGVSVGEGDVLPIECNEGSVLNIRSAAYGKPPNCAASKSLSVVESLCNGKRRCKVAANNRVFGDPCPGIGKQLTVQYNCYLTVQTNYYCNFTIDTCQWIDDVTATFKWSRHQGQSAGTGDTGPSGDHTTGSSGWYIYVDSSKPRKKGDVARLISVTSPSTAKSCFNFWYYIYGASIGSFTVYSKAKHTGKMTALWTKHISAGPSWRHGTLEVSSENEFQLVLEGKIGSGESGDIALDDINYTPGACPPSDECSFEDDTCGWAIKAGRGIKWIRSNPALLHDTYRFPATDHTCGTKYGYYMTGQSTYYSNGIHGSTFTSPLYPSTQGRCLTFWFVNKYASLKLYMNPVGFDPKLLWNIGASGDSIWIYAQVTVQSTTNFTITYEASEIHIANTIDDIMFLDGPCDPEGNCDFERGMCGYFNDRKDDDFDWLLGSGQRTSRTGPAVDHTSSTAYGQYMFIVPAAQEIHEQAILLSENINVPSVGKCFSFWYYLRGNSAGSLKVQMEIVDKSLTTVWQLDNNNHMNWMFASVPLNSQQASFLLHIIGIRGIDKNGKIAIDDLEIDDYETPCSMQPVAAIPWGCNFELGLCKWQQVLTDQFDWILLNGSSKARPTLAPLTDHTLHNSKGEFLFFDGNAIRDDTVGTAAIISPPIKTTGQRAPFCLSFSYTVKGNDHIPFMFLYTVLNGVKNEPIWQAPLKHTWKWVNAQVQLNVVDQTRLNVHLHRKTNKGNYLFFDAFSHGGTTGFAQLISSPIDTDARSPYCLSFAYFQQGVQSPLLSVLTQRNNELSSPLWQSNFHQTWHWYKVNVQLNIDDQTKVVFQGERGKNFYGGLALDDIDLNYGDCINSGTCSFEHPNICNWETPIPPYQQIQWSRKSLSTISKPPSLLGDHTYNTKYGHFMYLDYTTLIDGRSVTLQSSLLNTQGPTCMQFFYFMDMAGSTKDSLTVVIRRKSGYPKTLRGYETTGPHPGWNMGQVSMSRASVFTLQFKLTKYGSKSGTIAIDDFSTRKGMCPPLGNCDFDQMSMCSWTQGMKEDDFDWTLGSGNTPGFNTGPSVDHSSNSSTGFYAFIDSSKAKSLNEKAILKSVTFNPTFGRCLSFWYYMYGSKVGTLDAILNPLTKTSYILWTLSGNQGKGWKQGRMPIKSSLSYKIQFRGTRSKKQSGDIAIDDIEFSDGLCAPIPPVAGQTTAAPVTITKPATTAPKPTTGNNDVDCNFDQNFCPNWKASSVRKEFNWARHQGETDTSNTGPHSDHTTGTGKGYYVYINAAPPAQLNDTAFLINNNVINKYGGCFEFWYHMYGENIGTLSLYTTTGITSTWRWFKQGTQGDQWKSGQVYIKKQSSSTPITIQFVGTRGNGYQGDIALDDIAFAKGDMCQYRECTFEEMIMPYSTSNADSTELRCEWTNEQKTDNLDWYLGAGHHRYRTGTSYDHTLGTDAGHYVYLDSNNKKIGSKAQMVSQQYEPTQQQCFTVWYYMYGPTMGNLTIYQRSNGNDSALWTHINDEGPIWRRAFASIKSPSVNYQIVLEGTVGGSFGDIMVDDISKVDGTCPSPGDCNFEDFIMCGYVQDRSASIDWIRGHGSTLTGKTGPSTDHTIGDKTGHYYYIDSAGSRLNSNARLLSETFPPTDPDQGRCLQFYRHMYGVGLGKLNVYIKKIWGYRTTTLLVWSDEGDQGNQWLMSQVPIYSDKPYKIIIEAVRGKSKTGDIAIDDLNFNNFQDPCTFIPTHAAPPTPKPTTITPQDSSCDFEKSCRWSNLKRNDMDWYVKNADRNPGTGPEVDHTIGTYRGHCALLSVKYQKQNDTGVYRSPNIQSRYSSVCFSFAYFMFGKDMQPVKIYKVTGNTRQVLWTRSHDMGFMWRTGHVEIKGANTIFHIEIEGRRGQTSYGDVAMDDFVVKDGKCPHNDLCDFEDDMCDYTSYRTSSSSKIQWTRGSQGNPAKGDGPKIDHTTQSTEGNYIYLKTGFSTKEGTKASIQSRRLPKIHYNSAACYNFWYHLMGDNIGTINIYKLEVTLYSKSKPVLLWTKSGDQGSNWNHGRFTVTPSRMRYYKGYQIIIEGVTGKNNVGDIAIDDIWISDDKCPHDGSCDFEAHSFCYWTNVPGLSASWEMASGYTGYHTCSNDHTRGDRNGVRVQFKALDYGHAYENAQLVSKTLPATKGQCLSYWYWAYTNKNGGSFNITVMSSQNDTVQTMTFGNQYGQGWQRAEVGLYSQSDFKVLMAVESFPSSYNFLAIDDIEIKEGNCVGTCSSLPPTARVRCGPPQVKPLDCQRTYGCCYSEANPAFPYCYYHPSTCESIPIPLRVQCGSSRISSYGCKRLGCCYDSTEGLPFTCYNSPIKTTDFPSTLAPTTTPAPSKYDCSFEHGWCGFGNLPKDNSHWMMHQGDGRIGIWHDHTLDNHRGHFALHFVRYSTHRNKLVANLQTPTINMTTADDQVCIRFWYHMHGRDTFNVFRRSINETNTTDPVWYRPGDVPHGWNYAQVRVSRLPPFKIIFQAVRGYGWMHHIAIDDVSFVSGECPPNSVCDFENGDLCGWSQDPTDDFDWSTGSGRTTTRGTGPPTDHTYHTRYGTYLYTEGDGHQPGDKARIESFPNDPTDGSCVEFYYYMKGIGIGTLNMWLRRGDYLDPTPMWSLSGDQGGRWTRALVTVVENTKQWKVLFEGVHGANEYSDIAIDDIKIMAGPCVPKGDCDFEKNLCGYQNARNNTQNWVSYSTKSVSGWLSNAPKADHTTGTPEGRFLAMIGGSWHVKKGQLISEEFQVNPNYKWCLQFYYFLAGDGMETMTVHIKYKIKYKWIYTSLLEEKGNHDDGWVLAKVNITSGYNFQVVFEGNPSYSYTSKSIVAMDDISFTTGVCAADPITTPSPCAVKCKTSGKCISSDKVCDFFPDCAQDGHGEDLTDEEDCDQNDFEKGFNRWQDASKGKFHWNRTHGDAHPGVKRRTGPIVDHTLGTAAGYYAFTDSSQGKANDIAVLNSPVIRQVHSTCVMQFWFHMFGGSVGTLTVYVYTGDRLTPLWMSRGNRGNKWNMGTVYVDRRIEPFQMKFKVERRRTNYGDIAIDDIKFVNCSLPTPSKKCPFNYFVCRTTHACVPQDKRCDYTDDCGDGTDEQDCYQLRYPYRCDFENGFCNWQQVQKYPRFPFRMMSGIAHRKYGPYYDHTTGTVSGHYMAGLVYDRKHPNDLLTSRIGSGYLQVSSLDQPCQMRFYYFFVAARSPAFNVKTRQCAGIGCNETVAMSVNSMQWRHWQRVSVDLHSDKPFQVLFELQAKRFGVVLIDDVSFYGCSAYNGTLPTTEPQVECKPHVEFLCHADSKCISAKYQCDYQKDCSNGEDEKGCGPCDFTYGTCDYTASMKTALGFSRMKPIKTTGPLIDHTSKSASGYFMMTIPTESRPHGPALLTKSLRQNNPTCQVQFYYYYNLTAASTISIQVVVGSDVATIKKFPVMSLGEWQTIAVPVGQPRVYSEGIVGVWAVKYTNGYKDTYTIKNDGTVMVKNKGRTTKLDPSDNEQIFPSAQGWFKTDRVHRQNTWEYVQVRYSGAGTPNLIIRHFCSDSSACSGTYRGLPNYCCQGSGVKQSVPTSWYLQFSVDSQYLALDDITFSKCSFPRSTGAACSATQFKCSDGSCILSSLACNFVKDCADGSDETAKLCKTYKERCNFENGLCNWKNDPYGVFQWSRGTGATRGVATNASATDHTTGTGVGYYMYVPDKVLGFGRLLSIIFKASAKKCTMSFFYHVSDIDYLSLSVSKQTSNDSMVPPTIKWVMPDVYSDGWQQAVITFSASRNYQVILEADTYDGYTGDLAIDDISFSPDCKPDPNAKLQPEAPECDPDGEFSCGDGQCISVDKTCNFVKDCKNGADEDTCPASCDLEGEDTCGWFNNPDNDMDWQVWTGHTPSRGTGPPFDHTKRTRKGHFLYVDADDAPEVRFPTSDYVSPIYSSGSYNCSFSFWYHMYHTKVQDHNDAMLNVVYKRNGVDTILWTMKDTSGLKWMQASVMLPHCPTSFMVAFEVIHLVHTITDVSIDDWKFDCAPIVPATCDNVTNFQCPQSHQCIPYNAVCDGDRNCCDGSDEEDEICKGYTRYDFETGFEGWRQLQDDQIDYKLSSGELTSQPTGPQTDHTYQESHGHYLYIDALHSKPKTAAVIVSRTIDAQAEAGCRLSFWYIMYGKDMGALAVYDAIWFGFPYNQTWYLEGDQGNAWKKAIVPLGTDLPFQVMFIATVGSGPLSVIALDDVMFSPQCQLSDKPLIGGPPTPAPNPCKPLFHCKSTAKCIPQNQVCDFEFDCPHGEDEKNYTCGYPIGFDNGARFGVWTNSLDDDYEYVLFHELKFKSFTAPKTDARGDKNGSFVWLDVRNKVKNGKAILKSPIFQNSYASCLLNFSFHIHGDEVGQLRVKTSPNETAPTVLFHVSGDQGDKWVNALVPIGRRRHPFTIDFVSYAGGGDGGIGIDEINLIDCAPPSTCNGDENGVFKCLNGACVDSSKVCDFIDDCGDFSDEDPNGVCSGYVGCNFDNGQCQFFQNDTDDFDWEVNIGETPSSNTGPTHDHTFFTSDGIYMYVEASQRKEGDKTQMSSFNLSHTSTCEMMFFYSMKGLGEGALNVYSRLASTSLNKLEWSAGKDHGIKWQKAQVDLSHLAGQGTFVIIFEGVIGKSFLGDSAIDDVRFTRGCVNSLALIWPRVDPCGYMEFACTTDGACRDNSVKCDGKRDCKDGSDERACGGIIGHLGSNGGRIAGGILGVILVAAVVVGVLYMRRRQGGSDIFKVSYDNNGKDAVESKGVDNKSGSETPGFVTIPSGGIINSQYVDNTDYVDPAVADFMNDSRRTTTSIGNPLYMDPFANTDDTTSPFDF